MIKLSNGLFACLILALTFALASCLGVSQINNIAPSINAKCVDIEYLKNDVKKLVLPANITEQPSSGLQILDPELASHFDLINAQAIEITGNCARELDNFQISDLLSDSQIRPPTLPSDRNYESARSVRYSITTEDPHPILYDGSYLGAFDVGASTSEKGILQIYLGLWQFEGHSIVGFFTKDSSGAFSDVKPLLNANPRLRFMGNGITIGCQGGRLSLHQETQDGLRIYSISHVFSAMYSKSRGSDGNCGVHWTPSPEN